MSLPRPLIEAFGHFDADFDESEMSRSITGAGAQLASLPDEARRDAIAGLRGLLERVTWPAEDIQALENVTSMIWDPKDPDLRTLLRELLADVTARGKGA